MADIHPTAIVADGAEIAPEASVGPYCVLGPEVRLGAGVRLASHVVIRGRTTLGVGCDVGPFTSLGGPPQDLKHDGTTGSVEIGDHCSLREHVTVHTGSSGGGLVTRLGSHALLMVGAHIGHDCVVGDRVVMANSVHIGGHARIGDDVLISACTGVHQFGRIGSGVFIGAGSMVDRDVVPFSAVIGDRARLRGVNLRGLRRRGASTAEIRELRQLFQRLFEGDGTLAERIAALDRPDLGPKAREVVAFVTEAAGRALCQPAARL